MDRGTRDDSSRGDDGIENADDDSSGRGRTAVVGGGRLSLRQLALRVGTVVTVLGLVVLVAVVPAGILGLAIHDSATFTADPATPADSTLAETGFERTGADTAVVERRISPAGQERTIVVRNERRTYTKTIEVQNSTFDAGVFVTLSSPTVTVAGSERNPLAELSHRAILDRFQSEFDAGGGDATFRRAGQRRMAVLGQMRTVSEFRTALAIDGDRREFAVYVVTARSAGDVVVAVGLHPVAFAGERVSIMRLLDAVEHPAG